MRKSHDSVEFWSPAQNGEEKFIEARTDFVNVDADLGALFSKPTLAIRLIPRPSKTDYAAL